MRVLLDENIDLRLRFRFTRSEAYSARFAGFEGYKNGRAI